MTGRWPARVGITQYLPGNYLPYAKLLQVDLPEGTKSGLVDAGEKLAGIDGVVLHEMTRGDIVRHRLVQEIVNAYERGERGSEDRSRRAPQPRAD